MKITNKILKTIKSYKMFSPGDKVIVALSGGSDSVGLLHILLNLKSLNLKLTAAHFNHKLRGKESERDAVFVRQLVKNLGVEFEYGEAMPGDYSVKGLSPEDAARRLRYKFLRGVLKKCKAHIIATAHTLDDQAETVIMRIIRGSGSHGLSGIPPVNDKIVRPIIEIQKKEIREYLDLNKISWIEDSSNSSKQYQRNKIRLELFPFLEEINPGVSQVLSRSSEIFRIESDFITECVNNVFKSIIKKKPFGYIGRSKKYLSKNKAVRLGILRKTVELIKGDLKSFSAIHLLAIDEMIESDKSSGEIVLPDNIRFNKGYRLFCLSEKSGLDENFSYKIEAEGEYKFENGLKVSVDVTTDKTKWSNESVGFFSPKRVRFPVVIRSYKPGDRFRPLGLKGFKKVKDLFIDEKIPKFLRRSIPVFESADGIIWVGGVRNDDRFKVSRNESSYLRIKISKPELKLINSF
ncbi:MAG: tRNA lysidine(34) synthetase TilS [Thermodesulfobacteriota bacterium]